jgi:hypothetical protein
MAGLANRVDPFGTLFSTPSRGTFLGNRGGQFHCAQTRTIHTRPYASRQWICCLLSFKNRRRQVWGRGYTELFFADEVSALAAGHRPCFECRRADAVAFAVAWGQAQGTVAPRAPEMDRVLHIERLQPGRAYAKRLHQPSDADLPEGAMVAVDGKAYAVSSNGLRHWSYEGFGPPISIFPQGRMRLLTPPSIVAVLAAGYRPAWRLRGQTPDPG